MIVNKWLYIYICDKMIRKVLCINLVWKQINNVKIRYVQYMYILIFDLCIETLFYTFVWMATCFYYQTILIDPAIFQQNHAYNTHCIGSILSHCAVPCVLWYKLVTFIDAIIRDARSDSYTWWFIYSNICITNVFPNTCI